MVLLPAPKLQCVFVWKGGGRGGVSSFYGGSVRGTELRQAFWPVVTDIRWSHVRNPANHIPTGEHRNPWQCFGLVAEVVTPGSTAGGTGF